MRAFCNLVNEGRPSSLSFSYNHMYRNLAGYIDCDIDSVKQDTTHYLIMDLDISVDSQIGYLKKLRRDGVKVVLMVFDPAAFPRVDNLISNDALDKVVLFDVQFRNRFPIPTYITDYFFYRYIFPIASKENNNRVCVFGHLMHGRNNDFSCERVDGNVDSLQNIYTNVVQYNGVAIYDTGLDESRSKIVHYNKAKAVEVLLCGRNAYCQDGIKTKRYDRFLKKYSDIPNPKEIDFTQEEIFKINDLTIQELIYECKYI